MSPTGVRVAAGFAVLSAVTTFLLWLLTGTPRLWVNFAHIFFALVAYGATAFVLFRTSPSLASFGFLWFVLWGFTELLGVTANLFRVPGFAPLWDAMFFLLLVAFLLGTACFGLAAMRSDPLGRWVGVLFLLAVPLTIGIMVGGYTKVHVFDAAIGAIYPVLQPVSRALLGVWLWRRASEVR